MIEIGVNKISKNFGFSTVLDSVSFELMTGDRLAIVGRNGAGKSTIFNIIAGEEDADQGTIYLRKGATVGYLEQIPKLFEDPSVTVDAVLRSSFAAVYEAQEQLTQLEGRMAETTDPSALEKLMEQYAALQDQFIAMDGYGIQEQFAKIVGGFGLTPLLDRPFNVLSGGQKTVVKLASIILKRPDILLLDEPTNHLDVSTLEWFEGFLSKFGGTVVMISHDRYFLDKVATKTLILDRGVGSLYPGNYTYSLKEQERELLEEFERYKTQQRAIAEMKAAIKRYRDWGRQGDNPKFFRKAAQLELRLEKMEMVDKPQMEKAKINIAFQGDRTGKEVLKVEAFFMTLGAAHLFDDAGMTLYEREKCCLIGDNGTGKTAFIEATLGENPFQGSISFNPSAAVGYIPQEIRFDNDTETVLQVFRREYICAEGEARSILAKYFFYGEHVFKRVGSLSGGEKVLLKLAVLMQNKVNLLILDEPTNHIDIETREVLEEALLRFTGTLLFVSHDRYFINKIANRILLVDQKNFESFYGNYDEFKSCHMGL